MRAGFPKFLKELNPKRFAALAIGPGILVVGIDAAVAHLAGREDVVVPAQYIPVLFAPAALFALTAAGLPKLGPNAFRRILRIVGAAGVAVGTVGSAFHAHAFARLLQGTPLTFAGLEAALAVAPPLFAPGAFAGMGALLWLLANPRFTLKLEAPAKILTLLPSRAPLTGGERAKMKRTGS